MRKIFTACILIVSVVITSASSYPIRQGQSPAGADAAELEKRMEALAERGRYLEAIPLAENLLTILKQRIGENNPVYARVVYRLASFYRDTGRYDKVEPLLVKAAELVKNGAGATSPPYAFSITLLGLFYRQVARYKEAEPLLLEAKKIVEMTGAGGPDHVSSLINLANLYTDTGRYDEAEHLFLTAASLVKDGGGEKSYHYATVLNNQAVLYLNTGRFDLAEPLLVKAEALAKQTIGTKDPVYLDTLGNLASLYTETSRYEKVEPLFNLILEIREKTGGVNNPKYALSLQRLGYFYIQTGRYDKAEKLYEQARNIAIAVSGKNSELYLNNINDLAHIYQKSEKIDQAETLFLEAIDRTKETYGPRHRNYAWALNSAGSFYLYVRNYEKAESLLLEARKIAEAAVGVNSNFFAAILNNLAELYRRTGRYAQAEQSILKTLEITRRVLGERSPYFANSVGNLAGIYQATGRRELAVQTLSRSMEIEQSLLTSVFDVSSERAMRSYLSTIEESNDLAVSLVYDQPQKTGAEIDAVFGWVLRRKALIIDTLARFRQTQLLAERDPAVAKDIAQLRAWRQQISNLPIKAPLGTDDTGIRTKIASLNDEVEKLEAKLNRRLALQVQAGENVRIDAVRQRLPADSALVEFVRADIYDYRATGAQSKRRPARYLAFVLQGSSGSPVQMIDLAEAAPIDDAVREVRNNIAASSSFFTGKNEQQVREAEQDREDGYRQLGQKLYGLTFEKVRAKLGKSTMIYIVPDGQLNLVPFEALVDSDGRYLIENFQFAYLSSGRDLLRVANKTGKGAVIFGEPNYDLQPTQHASVLAAVKRREGAASRPGSAVPPPSNKPFSGEVAPEVRLKSGGNRWPLLDDAGEANIAERLLSTSPTYRPLRKYVGNEALEEMLKRAVSPRLLHISTHGFFLEDLPDSLDESTTVRDAINAVQIGQRRLQRAGRENPLLRSGLVLAGANSIGEDAPNASQLDDGWVTAEEISLMNLQGTDLVVLSACETALGDVKVGEGVYGLRRAFQLAGANTLISTLFKVPAAQSADMMEDFYEGLKAGKGKLAALHDAQTRVIQRRREQGGAAHPFFWASFVLVGNPN